MAIELPTFIPLSEAARRLGLSVDTLTDMIESGRMKAATLPDGAIVVSESGLSEAVTRDQFEHLRRHQITVSEAAEKYNLHRDTVLNWARRRYITVLESGPRGSRWVLDEADVAYCAAVYRTQGGGRGVRIFDEDGEPYQLKHPWLAEYRKQKKQKQSTSRTRPATLRAETHEKSGRRE